MLRWLSSLLVVLLGTAGAPSKPSRARPGTRVRRRRPEHADGAGDAVEITERPRARARQTRPTWPGEVELTFNTHTVSVPGTWALESAPPVPVGGAAAIPDLELDGPAWAERMRSILTLQEPGSSLRVRDTAGGTWRTLELRVATTPVTSIEVDRSALEAITGATAVSLRLHGAPEARHA